MTSSNTAEPATQLDHVVILLPYSYLASPPSWLIENFTLSPGGRHTDNKTENRLILFPDGTYIELISFIHDDPKKREGHRWNKPYGIIDYALTTKSDFDYDGLVVRLRDTGSGISYQEPEAGGRKRPDGVDLKWKVTHPIGAERGEVPFWCHDVTPRDRRVPEGGSHACGALGMAGLRIEVPEETARRVEAALPAITKQSKMDSGFAVGHPKRVDDLKAGFLKVQALQSGDDERQRLTLVLQAPGQTPRDIDAAVGGGHVRIQVQP